MNRHISYEHFKMEGLYLLKDLLSKNVCAYFSILLHNDSKKYVRLLWEGQIYQFLCLYFRLAPVSKLMKVPIPLVWKLSMKAIVFLDDILLMGRDSLEETLIARDT